MNSTFAVAKVGNELNDALRLREALQGEDPQLVADMIEGSTNLHEALCVVVEMIGEEEMMLAGIDSKLEELNARHGRIKTTVSRYRDIIASAMDRAGIKTIKSPTATITLRSLAPKVIVTDELRIAARRPDLFVQPPLALDRKSLKEVMEALPDGEVIPGAEWSNGGASVTIRRV